jgi:hypothetical protein
MFRRIALLVLFALLASAGHAQTVTIYKYRLPGGGVEYSNRLVPRAELIETFEYRFAEPVPAERVVPKSEAEAEARIQRYLAALRDAWTEVQEARKALDAAEARLATGVEPKEEEGRALAGPATPVPPAAGGPQPPAPPAAGGPQAPASPAAGGPLGTRHGGGRSVEFAERMQALEADMRAARARMETALRRYNELR